MNDEIQVLVDLSQADLECARLSERADAIPRELSRHEAELNVQRRALEVRERHLEDLQRERRLLELDAETAKSRRRELEIQQFRIKNNVEYQAMIREIDEMRRRASEIEDQALALMSDEETAQADIARLRELVAQEERKLSGVRVRLEGELAQYRDRLAAARGSRENLVGRLEPQLRGRYERIRRSKGDLAVVGVSSGACAGCGYNLPPQRIVEIQKMERVVACEGCGRMLVWTAR